MSSSAPLRNDFQKRETTTTEKTQVPDCSTMIVGECSSSIEMLVDKDMKSCTVCGDKALGFNFNALSCESCKAFFRRNAFKDLFGRCDGACKITVTTRSYCKKCRLKKCFAVGMNRNLILSDEQRSMRKKRGRPVVSLSFPSQTEVGTLSDDVLEPFSSGRAEASQKLPNVIVDPPLDRNVVTSCDLPQKNIQVGGYIEVIEHLYQIPENMRPLIRHLAQAFYSSLEAEAPKTVPETPSQIEFMNMADHWVRRLVKLNKKIEEFQQLSTDDQIALLKGSMVELLIMLSVTTFDAKTKSWNLKHHGTGAAYNISSENIRSNMDVYAEFLNEYFTFMISFLNVLQGDRILLMLLVMLSVFSSDRPNIVHDDIISKTQFKYALVLYDYTRFKYPNETNLFARLIMKLTELREINESHSKALAEMKLEDIEPLCAEIYDIC